MLNRLLFNLINNSKVVEKLAESRPIRRAAQITAYAIIKAQIARREVFERVIRSPTVRQVRSEVGKAPGDLGQVGNRLRKVRDTFVNEVKEGWKEGSRQLKK